jgi:hypothetical protein
MGEKTKRLQGSQFQIQKALKEMSPYIPRVTSQIIVHHHFGQESFQGERIWKPEIQLTWMKIERTVLTS